MISRPLQITIFLLLVGVLAGGVYLSRLKQSEEHRGEARNSPLPPPVSGTPEKIDLMIAYDDDGVMRKEQASVALSQEPAARAKQVLRALISEYAQRPSPHPLSEASGVRDIYMLHDGLCVVDMNRAFADGHRPGVMLEEMTIASFVESLAMNVKSISHVKFLVDGKERETLAGHADLKMIYDVGAIHQLVSGWQIQ